MHIKNTWTLSLTNTFSFGKAQSSTFLFQNTLITDKIGMHFILPTIIHTPGFKSALGSCVLCPTLVVPHCPSEGLGQFQPTPFYTDLTIKFKSIPLEKMVFVRSVYQMRKLLYMLLFGVATVVDKGKKIYYLG